jgi:hypothetical protein
MSKRCELLARRLCPYGLTGVHSRAEFRAGFGNALDIDTKSFRCITKMAPVRQFYVDNLQGNLDATLRRQFSGQTLASVPRGGDIAELPPVRPSSSPPPRAVLRQQHSQPLFARD